MDVIVPMKPITSSQATAGMRRPFIRAFGRSWVANRLAQCAWPAFQAALLHGAGITTAASHARVAAEERNLRTALVARWSSRRIAGAVQRAADAAANAT